ncbi:MAG: hypothetical protein EA384_13510 [Spirochaetaceae bacterium]|nr:MAG: hypothetical protein EA384_13510 [Spirochaetaceae bacterium]
MQQPDAQAIILELWRKRQALRERGQTPRRVVLSMHNYRLLQQYHATLGELPDPDIDYITRYTVFDLPVYIDDTVDCTVE